MNKPAITPGEARTSRTAALCIQALSASLHLPDCAHTKIGTIKVSANRIVANFTFTGYSNAYA